MSVTTHKVIVSFGADGVERGQRGWNESLSEEDDKTDDEALKSGEWMWPLILKDGGRLEIHLLEEEEE